jgi:hypothetical protein
MHETILFDKASFRQHITFNSFLDHPFSLLHLRYSTKMKKASLEKLKTQVFP